MRHANKVLVAAVFVLVPLAAYVGGYFGLCHHMKNKMRGEQSDDIIRLYAHAWESRIFRPLGWLESQLTGVHVDVWSEDEWPWEVSGPWVKWWF